MLRRLLRRFSPGEPARSVYGQIVAQARQPAFYAVVGVPDSPEGRFDMIVLHAVLLMRRLRGEGAAGRDLSQAVFDTFFADMDHSLREMGVSDLGVPKRVRSMVEAFYGRAAVYDSALAADGTEGLQAALNRNLFGGNASQAGLESMAAYVHACEAALAAQSGADLMSAAIAWPAPPAH